ncbi:MAG TPA: hypothetical protein VEB86_15675 [Chryseosolibacter sp.]|nr:hypothetical protein [Chryseosolibacter sp.]
MISVKQTAIAGIIALTSLTASAQNKEHVTPESMASTHQTDANVARAAQKIVVVTGARFSYAIIEKWIDEYLKVRPDIQVVVESRGSADPKQYDILTEVYEHDEESKNNRAYVYVGRYAILPVATAGSGFAKTYSEKGLDEEMIQQIFFHDIFSGTANRKAIKEPYTTYTRLQRAGVPHVFSKYFGHEQNDIKGVGIAGADVHLVKALLRDSVGVTYLPVPLIFESSTRQLLKGLVILPVDLNGNGKVTGEERIFADLDKIIEKIETANPKELQNVPIGYLHLSVDRKNASAEAIDFLTWVKENGDRFLREFGYLKPDSRTPGNAELSELAASRR